MKTKVLSSSAVQVSWSKPIFNGGGQGIIGYEIYYNVSNLVNNKVNVQSPDDYSKKVTGLTPYTTYKFTVAAKTDAGSGPISTSIFAETFEDSMFIFVCVILGFFCTSLCYNVYRL